MNELLAIIIIVVVCCAMFIAWLVSMAVCPDTVVDFISGTRHQTKDKTASGDFSVKIAHESSSNLAKARSTSNYSQVDGSHRQIDLTGKKLSVVPEVDEQLTIQSKVSAKHPTILRPPEEE